MRHDKQIINFANKEVVNYSAIANKAKSLSDGIRSIDFDRINDSITFNSSLVHNRTKVHVKPSNNSINNVSELNFNDNSTLTGITSDSSNTDPTKAISSAIMIDVNNRIEKLETKTQNQTATENTTTFTGNVQADTFNGYHLGFNNRFYTLPAIPFVNSDLVMDIGRYIDFHYNAATGTDRTSRLYISKPGTLYYDHSFVVSGGDIKARNCIADNGNLRDAINKIAALETKNTEQDTRLDALETKNTEQDTRLDALESKDIAHEERLGSIEAMDTAQNESISTIEGNIASMDYSFSHKIYDINDKIADLESKDIKHEERIGSIEAMDTAQNETLSNINTKNNEQDTRLDTIEAKDTEQDTRLDTLDRKDLEQDIRLDTLETKNTEQDTRLDTIEAKDTEQDTRLDDLEKYKLSVTYKAGSVTPDITHEFTPELSEELTDVFNIKINITFEEKTYFPTFAAGNNKLLYFEIKYYEMVGGTQHVATAGNTISAINENGNVILSGNNNNYIMNNFIIEKGKISLDMSYKSPNHDEPSMWHGWFSTESTKYYPNAVLSQPSINEFFISKNLAYDNEERLTAATNKNNEQDTRISNLESKISNLLDKIYPVGSIYLSLTKSPPSLGGTWELIDEGKFLYSTTSTSGETGGSLQHTHETANHVLTAGEMPKHKHTFKGNKITGTVYDIMKYDTTGQTNKEPEGAFSVTRYGSRTWQGTDGSNRAFSLTFTATPSGSISNEGSDQAHNHGKTSFSSNLPPYITCFMYKRIT